MRVFDADEPAMVHLPREAGTLGPGLCPLGLLKHNTLVAQMVSIGLFSRFMLTYFMALRKVIFMRLC
jgi:hypothetical protein